MMLVRVGRQSSNFSVKQPRDMTLKKLVLAPWNFAFFFALHYALRDKTNIASCSRPSWCTGGSSRETNVLWRRRWLFKPAPVRRQYSLSSGIRPGCRAHDRRGAEAQQEQETLANRHLLTNSSRCLHAGCFFFGGVDRWGFNPRLNIMNIWDNCVCVSIFLNPPGCILGSFFQAIFTYRKLQKNENVKSYEKYCSIFLGLLEIHKVTSDSYSAAETFATEEIDLHLLVLQSNSMDRLMTFSFHFMIIVNGFNSLENGPRTFGARKRHTFENTIQWSVFSSGTPWRVRAPGTSSIRLLIPHWHRKLARTQH